MSDYIEVLTDASSLLTDQESLLEKQAKLIDEQSQTIKNLLRICNEQASILDKLLGKKK